MPAGVLGNTAQESWWALCAAALFESCTVHHKILRLSSEDFLFGGGTGLEQGGSDDASRQSKQSAQWAVA